MTIIKPAIFRVSISEAMTISADLGSLLEGFVTTLVETGRYNSKSEVLREGIRLIQEREARLAVLDLALAKGIADAELGAPNRQKRYSHGWRPSIRPWVALRNDRRTCRCSRS